MYVDDELIIFFLITMAFPSEASANPFGGASSYLHKLRKGVEPITNPSPGPGSGSRKRQRYGVTIIPLLCLLQFIPA